jgi:hypothetical protein
LSPGTCAITTQTLKRSKTDGDPRGRAVRLLLLAIQS